MADGTRRDRGGQPKRISVGELDAWMVAYAAEEPSDANSEDDADPDAQIPLPYDFSLALDLWVAWDKHGVMPLDYLRQPKAWRDMVHHFNQRLNRAQREKDEQIDYQDLLGGDGLDTAQGWAEFTRGGRSD